MSSKQGGKAKPLKKPKSDKKDYDEEVGKVVDGRDTSECSQFNDPLKKSCLERGDQGSKMKLRKRRKRVYYEVQGPSDKPTVKFLRSMKKNIVVTVLLRRSVRLISKVAMIEAYPRANKLFVDYNEPQQDRVYSSYLELNLDEVEPCILGPKRSHDRVPLKEMKADWHSCLDNKVGFKVLMNSTRCQEK